MDEPRWVSELPYAENVRQLPLCTASPLTRLSLICSSASAHGGLHLHDCLSVVSFSWQVWQSPWGWWRDLAALARGEQLPLWERTVMTPRGNMRSTATTLSSVIASPWTGASLTTDLKSKSTSCFFLFYFSFSSSKPVCPALVGLHNARKACKCKV